MSVAPAPEHELVDEVEEMDDERNPNMTASNIEEKSIISPEPLFPPIRGAAPAPPKIEESIVEDLSSP